MSQSVSTQKELDLVAGEGWRPTRDDVLSGTDRRWRGPTGGLDVLRYRSYPFTTPVGSGIRHLTRLKMDE